MKSTLYMLIFACVAAPSFAANAQQQPSSPPDAVTVMVGEYYEHFKNLPPTRKCAPEDAKGAWKEIAIFESGSAEVAAQKLQGPKYLAFGDYNTLVWRRVQTPVEAELVVGAVRQSPMQYISTAAGMLYVYQKGLQQDSLLCFIATEATKNYQPGTLLLARPLEKDKSLTITLYEPLK